MKAVIRDIKQGIAQVMPPAIYFPFANAKNAVQGRRQRLRPMADGLVEVFDGQQTICISQRIRHTRYKRGITTWTDFLASQYNLNKLQVRPGGVFIDCGANVGELGYWARSKQLQYHAFEPETREANCCDLNNFGGQPGTNRMGLWHESTELKFYSKPESADSSFIEIADYHQVKTIKVTTLDQYVREKGIQSIEVFKVEAEGAEPEVLQGARQTLPLCRFVTVDCGRERGIEAQDTVRDVCNVMYQYGFRMAESDMIRLSLLFENRAQAERLAA